MELDGQMGLFAPEPPLGRDAALTPADGVTLVRGDCFDLLPTIPDGSVDMILCDLPYGTTQNHWDVCLPLDRLWSEWRRVAKKNAAVVLFAAQPFTTTLISSNRDEFRYCWYWKKDYPVGGVYSHVQPMRCIEDICVFYRRMPTYQPQGLRALEKPVSAGKLLGPTYDRASRKSAKARYLTGYPTHLLCFGQDGRPGERDHPTQKPVALLRYLIKTYTKEGEVVLDSCMGSGSAGVAAVETGRQFIGMELDPKYFGAAQRRIAAAIAGEEQHGLGCKEGG